MDKVKAFKNLCDVRDVLIKLDIPYWLDGGTLLGAIRENGFMDSDFDIDFGIFNTDKDIISELKQIGFEHFHFKQHPTGIGKQISCIRYGISIDIFFYFGTQEHFRIMFDILPNGCKGYIPCVLPNNIFTDIKQIDFMDSGEMFNVPKDSERYLTLQYGDWKVDKKAGEFKWQTDYKCYAPDYKFWDKPNARSKFVITDKLIPTKEKYTGTFFNDSIKKGYKLYPLIIDKDYRILDGNKKYWAYKELGVPMLEVYCA